MYYVQRVWKDRILPGRFLRKLQIAHIIPLGETHIRMKCEETPIKPTCFMEKLERPAREKQCAAEILVVITSLIARLPLSEDCRD